MSAVYVASMSQFSRAKCALPRPVVKARDDKRCVHCGDWIKPDRRRLFPEADDCRECADELEHGVIRP